MGPGLIGLLGNAVKVHIMPLPRRRTRTEGSIRQRIGSHLLTLVLLAVVPMLAFAGFLIFRIDAIGRAEFGQQVQLRDNALAEAVDRELGIHRALLMGMQNSAALVARNWPAFRTELATIEATYPWARLSVMEPSGQLLFTSILPDGAPLPMANGLATLRRAIDTGEPQTSDYFIGSATHRPTIATYLPLIKAGRTELVLAISCDISRFQEIVEAQTPSPSMRAAIIDNRNVYIARATEPATTIGTPGTEDLREQTSRATSGMIKVVGLHNKLIWLAFTHSKLANWTIAAGIDVGGLLALRNRSLTLAVGGGLLLLAMSLASAFWYGRRIAAQAALLSAQATALGKGGPLPGRRVDIFELANVARELETAAARLAQEQRHRQAILDQLERRVLERTAALSESERQYRLLAENSVDVIVHGDFDGTCRYVSPASQKLFGYAPQELLAHRITSVIHPDDLDDLDQVDQTLARLHQEEVALLCVYRVRKKNGECVWVEGAFRRFLTGDEGTASGFLVTLRDVSARKQAETAAIAAKTAADRANQAKSLFLASMSHELRTPLTAIIGFGQMLEATLYGPLTERQAEYVEYILRGGNTLLTLVQDLLDFASIDTAPVRVDMRPVALDMIFDELGFAVAQMAAERSINLEIQRGGPDAPAIFADRRRLVQVMANLCSNAIKYNRPGGSVTVAASFDEPGWVILTVTDTGLGIAADKQDEIFEPFNRLGAEAGTIEGTGVGLTICKRLMDAMGGRISFTSTLGVGTRFVAMLPLAAPESSAVAALIVSDGDGDLEDGRTNPKCKDQKAERVRSPGNAGRVSTGDGR
jgi:PAS domain S-box-containing protein